VSVAGNIGELHVRRDVLRSAILAGLDTVDGILGNGNDVLGRGMIGRARIGGSLIETSVSAGVAPGPDGQFGTDDDMPETDPALSVIEKIKVRREIHNNPDEIFGIVAADEAPNVVTLPEIFA
jgi:hypothetical protein